MKDKHYASIDEVIAEIAGIPIEDLAEPREDGRHLITREELLAAGALDVPASWRKSLGEETDLFSKLFEDDTDTRDESSADEEDRPRQAV